MLCQLRRIARSEMLEESEKVIPTLKDSEIWKTNTKFFIYFSKYWLTVKIRKLGKYEVIKQAVVNV